MKKFTKLLSIFALAGAIGAGTAGIVGCKHKHSYKGAPWVASEEDPSSGHYHKATCKHTDVHDDLVPHTWESDTDTTCDDCGYTRTISSPTVAVTSVTITSAATFVAGQQLTLTATVAPDNASNKTVTWSIVTDGTTAEGAAITDGKLTATGAGTVKVKATAGGVDSTVQTITVTAAQQGGDTTVEVTSVTITSAATFEAGQQLTLAATVAPDNAANKTVTWSIVTDGTTAEGAAITDGKLTATGEGVVKLKATAGGVDSEVQTITVTAATVAVTSVTISGDITSDPGQSVTLTAAVLPDNATNKTVTWTLVTEGTTAPGAAVSTEGVVTATGAGTVKVKATADGVDSEVYSVKFLSEFDKYVAAKGNKIIYSNDFETAGTVPAYASINDFGESLGDNPITETALFGSASAGVTDGAYPDGNSVAIAGGSLKLTDTTNKTTFAYMFLPSGTEDDEASVSLRTYEIYATIKGSADAGSWSYLNILNSEGGNLFSLRTTKGKNRLVLSSANVEAAAANDTNSIEFNWQQGVTAIIKINILTQKVSLTIGEKTVEYNAADIIPQTEEQIYDVAGIGLQTAGDASRNIELKEVALSYNYSDLGAIKAFATSNVNVYYNMLTDHYHYTHVVDDTTVPQTTAQMVLDKIKADTLTYIESLEVDVTDNAAVETVIKDIVSRIMSMDEVPCDEDVVLAPIKEKLITALRAMFEGKEGDYTLTGMEKLNAVIDEDVENYIQGYRDEVGTHDLGEGDVDLKLIYSRDNGEGLTGVYECAYYAYNSICYRAPNDVTALAMLKSEVFNDISDKFIYDNYTTSDIKLDVEDETSYGNSNWNTILNQLHDDLDGIVISETVTAQQAKEAVEAKHAQAITDLTAVKTDAELKEIIIAAALEKINAIDVSAADAAGFETEKAEIAELKSGAEAQLKACENNYDVSYKYREIADAIKEQVEKTTMNVEQLITDANTQIDSEITKAKKQVYNEELRAEIDAVKEKYCGTDKTLDLATAATSTATREDIAAALEGALGEIAAVVEKNANAFYTVTVHIKGSDIEETLSFKYGTRIEFPYELPLTAKKVTAIYAMQDSTNAMNMPIVILDNCDRWVEVEELTDGEKENYVAQTSLTFTEAAAASAELAKPLDNSMLTIQNVVDGGSATAAVIAGAQEFGGKKFTHAWQSSNVTNGSEDKCYVDITVKENLKTLDLYLGLGSSTMSGRTGYLNVSVIRNGIALTGAGKGEKHGTTSSAFITHKFELTDLQKGDIVKIVTEQLNDGSRIYIFDVEASIDETKVVKNIEISWINGTDAPVKTKHSFIETVAVPVAPTATGDNVGKVFGGWFTEENGAGTEYTAQKAVAGEYYAYWKEPIAVTVTINNTDKKVIIGSSVDLAATVTPDDNTSTIKPTVTWTVTAGTGTAEIVDGNKLKGLTAGTVTVTATSEENPNCTDSVEFEVVAPKTVKETKNSTWNDVAADAAILEGKDGENIVFKVSAATAYTKAWSGAGIKTTNKIVVNESDATANRLLKFEFASGFKYNVKITIIGKGDNRTVTLNDITCAKYSKSSKQDKLTAVEWKDTNAIVNSTGELMTLYLTTADTTQEDGIYFGEITVEAIQI